MHGHSFSGKISRRSNRPGQVEILKSIYLLSAKSNAAAFPRMGQASNHHYLINSEVFYSSFYKNWYCIPSSGNSTFGAWSIILLCHFLLSSEPVMSRIQFDKTMYQPVYSCIDSFIHSSIHVISQYIHAWTFARIWDLFRMKLNAGVDDSFSDDNLVFLPSASRTLGWKINWQWMSTLKLNLFPREVINHP